MIRSCLALAASIVALSLSPANARERGISRAEAAIIARQQARRQYYRQQPMFETPFRAGAPSAPMPQRSPGSMTVPNR